MIGRFRKKMSDLRRFFSRSEWATHILELPHSPTTRSDPGVILIQIDGLSRRQMETAMRHGKMPFLRRLREREEYRLHDFYSGMPSSTPSVQGELFYGIHSIVPSFKFRDHRDGRLKTMYMHEAAHEVEEQMAAKAEGLLKGGSAYSDIYTGGAAESHFCAASLGVDKIFRTHIPLLKWGVALLHVPVLLRIAALLIIETALALFDCLRGLIQFGQLSHEIHFIPTRVALCIFLREMITIGASLDAARGLPIIHLNYIGYDEQSHRRGPSSAFAHWTLKGIDHCIKRVWQAARRSNHRDYDVWIYSDHGQEATVPYEYLAREPLGQAIERILEEEKIEPMEIVGEDAQNVRHPRAAWLGGNALFRFLTQRKKEKAKFSPDCIPCMGPLGHLYLKVESAEAIARVARKLVAEGSVPLVVQHIDATAAKAYTAEGEFRLPEEAHQIFSCRHPFFEEVTRDLIRLAKDPNSGTLLLSGWRTKAMPVTFAIESGSHAGPGSEETRAFALFPNDAPVEAHNKRSLRPSDLRRGALLRLGRVEALKVHRKRIQKSSDLLRVMTYNVHSCRGMDGILSPERLARVIAQYHPDVVALQEIDVLHSRTESVDQARRVAELLEMDFHFHPAIHVAEEQYGDAILSMLPMRLVKSGLLPSFPHLEPRGAIWVEIDFNGVKVNLFNTHLGLRRHEKQAQIEALMSPDWLGHRDCRPPIVVCGDFNIHPLSRLYRRISGTYFDAAMIASGNQRAKGTWLGIWRIDHIFMSRDIQVMQVKVGRNALAKIASDHLPLMVKMKF